jgi:hypothetical protein
MYGYLRASDADSVTRYIILSSVRALSPVNPIYDYRNDK